MLEHVELLARSMPRLFGRALGGAFMGGLLGFITGALALAIAHVAGWGGGEGWVALGMAGVSILACTIGGVCFGALHGSAKVLAVLIEELRLVPLLWGRVKPLVHRYAEAVRSGAQHSEARAKALAGLRSSDDGNGSDDSDGSDGSGVSTPNSLAERAERYLAGLLHAALAGGLLRGLVGRDSASWDNVEEQGLLRAQEVVADLVARLFHGPALVVLFATALGAVLPQLIHTALGAAW